MSAVPYIPGENPTANNWNLLDAIPGAPAFTKGNAPDMIVAKTLNAIYNDSQSATSVTSIQGTANEIAVSSTVGDVVVSLPPDLILPNGTTAATQHPGDASNKVATTAFVATSARGVTSVASSTGQVVVLPNTGAVNLTLPSVLSGVMSMPDLSAVGTIATGAWHGTLIGPTYGGTGVNNGAKTITLGGNLSTSGAYASILTLTADTNVTLPVSGTLVNTAVTTLSSLVITESQVTNLTTDLGLKAPLASPALTGVPTAPTAAPGTNTTQLATTAFVTAAGGSGVTSLAGTTNQIDASASTGAVTLSLSSTLVLPNGTTATTQSALDNSTKVATTAYVDAASGGTAVSTGNTATTISDLQSSPDVDLPGANGDEFIQNSSGVPSGWSAITSGTPDTINTSSAYSQLYMVASGGGGTNAIKGIYKAIPSFPFTVTAKLSDWTPGGMGSSTGYNQNAVGILIGEAGSTGKLVTFQGAFNSSYFYDLQIRGWSSRTNATANLYDAGAHFAARPPVYLRLTVASTTSVTAWISYTGFNWTQVPISNSLSAYNPSFTIAIVGLFVDGSSGTTGSSGHFDWIRFT